MISFPIMTAFGTAAAVVLLLWLALLYAPVRWRPLGIFLFVPKILAVGYVPFLTAMAIVLACAGVLMSSWWIASPAVVAAIGGAVVLARVGGVSTDLTGALGPGWEHRTPADRHATTVERHWLGRLPRSPEPRLRRDVPFATAPATSRPLLCDVWQPALDVPASGVAVVYLHGSAYYILDKDLGTRPLFRHLASQGHVVVDVAYRLFPETDVPGMVADAKRAVAWAIAHCTELRIDPDRIVLVGGSAGGHLALLAAYAREDPALTPAELRGADPYICAVVSLYGQVSLKAMYYHTGQDKVCHRDDPQPDWTTAPSRTLVRLFGNNASRLRLAFISYAGRCDWMIGGTPTESPHRYQMLEVSEYVRSDSPPTLLMHGIQDQMAPISEVRHLATEIQRVGGHVTAIYLPHTDHMFDLVATEWSPAARVTVHTLERFLAALPDTPRPIQPRALRLDGSMPDTAGIAVDTPPAGDMVKMNPVIDSTIDSRSIA